MIASQNKVIFFSWKITMENQVLLYLEVTSFLSILTHISCSLCIQSIRYGIIEKIRDWCSGYVLLRKLKVFDKNHILCNANLQKMLLDSSLYYQDHMEFYLHSSNCNNITCQATGCIHLGGSSSTLVFSSCIFWLLARLLRILLSIIDEKLSAFSWFFNDV